MLPILAVTLVHLIDAALTCKPRKCHVFPGSNDYLAHFNNYVKIEADGIKVDKIREGPFPKRGNEMASFLGMWNYYRRLIPDFPATLQAGSRAHCDGL